MFKSIEPIEVSYDYYKSQYGGKVEADDFIRLHTLAFGYLDTLTMGRIRGQLSPINAERVQNALCAVIDAYALNESGGGKISETNDGISVTYASSNTAKSENKRLYDAAYTFLAPTGLLYRGMGHVCLR